MATSTAARSIFRSCASAAQFATEAKPARSSFGIGAKQPTSSPALRCPVELSRCGVDAALPHCHCFGFDDFHAFHHSPQLLLASRRYLADICRVTCCRCLPSIFLIYEEYRCLGYIPENTSNIIHFIPVTSCNSAAKTFYARHTYTMFPSCGFLLLAFCSNSGCSACISLFECITNA